MHLDRALPARLLHLIRAPEQQTIECRAGGRSRAAFEPSVMNARQARERSRTSRQRRTSSAPNTMQQSPSKLGVHWQPVPDGSPAFQPIRASESTVKLLTVTQVELHKLRIAHNRLSSQSQANEDAWARLKGQLVRTPASMRPCSDEMRAHGVTAPDPPARSRCKTRRRTL